MSINTTIVYVVRTKLCTKADFTSTGSGDRAEKVSRHSKIHFLGLPLLPAPCWTQSQKDPLVVLKLHEVGSQ